VTEDARDEEWLVEASRLLDKVRRLSGQERIVFKYFLDEVSVGILRAEAELSKKGVKDPESIIRRLEELGLLERGRDSVSLARPLRAFITRRPGVKI